MTAQPADVYELLKKIRYDATAIQAKVTDTLKLLGELNLQDAPTASCPHCGIEARGPRTLAEHLYLSHDGPVPEHFVSVETMSA